MSSHGRIVRVPVARNESSTRRYHKYSSEDVERQMKGQPNVNNTYLYGIHMPDIHPKNE